MPPTQVLLSKTSSPFSQKLLNLLQENSLINTTLYNPKEKISSSVSPQVVIHIAGFSPPSLATTLQHTSILHHLLHVAASHHSHFTLAVSMNPGHLHDVALSLVAQYAAVHNLSYSLLEISPDADPTAAASAIISTFLKNYSVPPPTPKHYSPLVSGLKLLTLLIVLPWVFYSLQLLVLYRLYSCSWNAINSGLWHKAQTCAQLAANLSNFVAPQTQFVIGAAPLLDSLGYPPSALAKLATPLTDSLVWTSVAGEQLSPHLTALLNPSSPTPSGDLNQTYQALSKLSESLALLQLQIRQSPSRPPLFSQLDAHLIQYRLSTNTLQTLLPDLPRFTSLSGTATYLLLLQDNTQLRPAGGTISSIAFVTLSQGHITNIEFHKVLELQNKLLGSVDLPPDLKPFLPGSSWQLRDNTWDPNIPESARQAAWFVTKATGQKFAGVILVNTNDPISLVTSLQANLAKLSPAQSLQTVITFLASFPARQSFFVPDPPSFRVSRVGWDGGLPNSPNFFYAVDSNLSTALPDQLISRHITALVDLTATNSATRLEFKYTHTGASGDFSNLLRVYIPVTSHISSLTLNSADLPLTTNPISIPFTLTPSHQALIVLRYIQALPPANHLRYQLDIPNQPGNAINLDLSLNYPPSWSASSSPQPQFATSGQVKYNATLLKPFQLNLDYEQTHP